MKLSILIPTHCRPTWFTRCLRSVLATISDNTEVIVNNDSNDISEIDHPAVTYHYNKFENLSQVYQFLLSRAQGEYVYFLEDDDYLTNSFFKVNLTADIIAGNYIPMYDGPYQLREFLFLFKNNNPLPGDFAQQLNLKHLQLSQFIFKRSTITDFDFPMDNNVHNDINLVLHSVTRAQTIQTVSHILYHQTTDGGDNISFPGTKNTLNTTASLDFLQKYETIRPNP